METSYGVVTVFYLPCHVIIFQKLLVLPNTHVRVGAYHAFLCYQNFQFQYQFFYYLLFFFKRHYLWYFIYE